MADRYEEIRKALEMGPTPGPRRAVEQSVIGPQDLRILSANVTFSVGVNGSHSVLIEEAVANAALAAACDPDTIRELLAERDALAAENERLKEDRARFPNKPDDIGRMIEAHIGNLKAGKKSTEALADNAFDRAFRAEAALAEKDKEIAALRKALSRILENEASDWKAAEEFGGYVLDDELREEARAALRAMGYEVPARD